MDSIPSTIKKIHSTFRIGIFFFQVEFFKTDSPEITNINVQNVKLPEHALNVQLIINSRLALSYLTIWHSFKRYLTLIKFLDITGHLIRLEAKLADAAGPRAMFENIN